MTPEAQEIERLKSALAPACSTCGQPKNVQPCVCSNSFHLDGEWKDGRRQVTPPVEPVSYWRVGSKVNLNVYEGDRPVCQCHTPEDAERITHAMNKNFQGRAESAESAEAEVAALRAQLEEAQKDTERLKVAISPAFVTTKPIEFYEAVAKSLRGSCGDAIIRALDAARSEAITKAEECEQCDRHATKRDVNGIPLCDGCYDDLKAETLRIQASAKEGA